MRTTILRGVAAAAAFASAAQAAPPAGDLLAPGGVEIGMTPEEAGAALVAAGFQKHAKCTYLQGEISAVGTLRIVLTTNDGVLCAESQPVRKIQATYRAAQSLDAQAVVDSVSAFLGEQPHCKPGDRPMRAECAWNEPASAPRAAMVEVNVAGAHLSAFTHAVHDIEKPHTERPPVDPALDPLAPVDALDPLAPGGLSVGMAYAEAAAALEAAGYQASRSSIRCMWRVDRKYELSVYIEIATISEAERVGCKEDDRVHSIQFRKTDYRPENFARAMQPGAAVAAWAARAGKSADSACVEPEARGEMPRKAECAWKGEAAPDGLGSLEATYQVHPRERSVTARFALSGVLSEPGECRPVYGSTTHCDMQEKLRFKIQ